MPLADLLKHTLMITSFVFIVMLLIEYLNVQTHGGWQKALRKNRWINYLVAALLGALPGCLGSFTVVSLYSHRILSLGALVATMIATSGDEAFVMFSMFPEKAALLTLILLVIAIPAGFLTDLLVSRNKNLAFQWNHEFEIHKTDHCNCFPKDKIIRQLKQISFARALLIGILLIFLIFLFTGMGSTVKWDWKRVTFITGSLFALFVVSTVPDHFLEKHLWEHVLKKHLLRIFLWTFGALLVIHFLENYINLHEWIKGNYYSVLFLAVFVGLIPESGPHLIFVTLFANGSLPFSILLVSSIVQDGHGMLPMLAVSRKGFLLVKGINALVGILAGIVASLYGML